MGAPPGFLDGDASFADATQYESFFNDTGDQDSDNGWNVIEVFTTENQIEVGRWSVEGIFKAGQTDKEKRFAVQIQTREGTSGGWSQIERVDTSVGFDDEVKNIAFDFPLDITTGGSVRQFRTRIGQTDDGGEYIFEEVFLKFYRVGDIPA